MSKATGKTKKFNQQGAKKKTKNNSNANLDLVKYGIDWDNFERKMDKKMEKLRERQGGVKENTNQTSKEANRMNRDSNFSDEKLREKKKKDWNKTKQKKSFERNENGNPMSRSGWKNSKSTKDEIDNKKGKGKSKNVTRVRTVTESGEKICPLYKKCGGCQLQGIDYEKQLTQKQRHVTELLGKFGKVNNIIGMENPYHYRNKVHAVFDYHKGKVISGIYQEGTHEVIPVEECLIEDKKADEIIGSIRELLKSFKIKTYDEDTGYGLFRHVLIRTGYHSGEIMVVLVLSSPILPSKNNFVKALCKLHPEITTIVINVNEKRTSMVLGEREHVIYGKGYITDTLCDCQFRISPKSFYQVNPVQTEVLYKRAIELAKLNGTQRVVDAYCGIGTIGLIASKHAKEVIGVELNKDAVKDAVNNAKLNGIKNISFYNNDAGRFMVELAEQEECVDVVFMDPPRAGSDEAFMNSVIKLAPEKVVYISCNPETLERDLTYMTKRGYRVEEICPVDMFAFTGHVETCVLLTRKNLASYNVEIKIDMNK